MEAEIRTSADKKTITYDGIIFHSAVSELEILIKENNPKIIRIRSVGGDYSSALQILDLIERNDIHIELFGYCGSACANYIFLLGGSRVSIGKNTGIFFHGDVRTVYSTAIKNSANFLDPNVFMQMSKLANQENLIFLKKPNENNLLHYISSVIGTGDNLTHVIGEDGKEYDCRQGGYTHWAPSAKTLKQLRIIVNISPGIDDGDTVKIKDLPDTALDIGVMQNPNCRIAG